MARKKPTNLTEMLEALEACTKGKTTVTFDDVLDTVGRRSFGPFVLVAGVTFVMPVLGDIPGVPTAVAVVVMMVVGQQLAGREQFWFPRSLCERKVRSTKLRKGVGKLRKPAKFVDRLVKPRLSWLTHGRARYAAAVLTAFVALCMPFMDFIPFSANVGGATLALIGLGLIAHDGLLLLIGSILAFASAAIVGYGVLG